MRILAILALFLFSVSCRSVRYTEGTKADTTVNTRDVEVPYDTTVKAIGFKNHLNSRSLPGLDPAFQFAGGNFSFGGVHISYDIIDGKINHEVSKDDQDIQVQGLATGKVHDTTIVVERTIVKEKKETWWEKTWRQAKDLILILLLLVVAISLIANAVSQRK